MQKSESISRKALAFVAVIAMIVSVNCGGGGENGSTPNTPGTNSRCYGGTQAPGDYYTYSVNDDGSWSGKNQTLNHDFSGTWSTLSSGFLKLNVEQSNDPNMQAPTVSYACELPSTALLVQRAPDKEIVVCSFLGGTVSPGTYKYWGIYNPKSDDPNTAVNEEWTTASQAIGEWEVTVDNDGKMTVKETPMSWSEAIGAQNWSASTTHSCFTGDNAGTYTLQNTTEQVRIASNPSGSFIIDFDMTNIAIAGAFGGPQTPLDWQGDVLKGEYIGFLFRSQAEQADEPLVFPVWAAPGTGEAPTVTDMWDAKSLYGGIFEDDSPEKGAETYDNGNPNDGFGSFEINGVRFNGTNVATPFGDGLFKVKDESNPFDPNGQDFFFTSFIDPISGKLIVYGMGADDEGKPFNVLLFQK